MRRSLWIALLFLVVGSCVSIFAKQTESAANPREQFQQYVIQLKANPSNDELRTKIIQLTLTLDPKPAIPEEAAAADGKAKTIFAHATSPDDLKAAAGAFEQATQLAPWVPDYYFNEAAAAEKDGQYDEAIHALNFYLLAAPNSPDAGEVRGRIDGIRFEEQKAAQQQAAAEQQVQESAREKATMFARRSYDQDNGKVAFEINGSSGAYVCTKEPSSWPLTLNGNPDAGTGRATISRCEASGSHLEMQESEVYDFPAVNYHVEAIITYDLVMSDDMRQLTGSMTVDGKTKAVTFVRND